MANRNFNTENRLQRAIVEFNRALPQDRELLEATELFRRVMIDAAHGSETEGAEDYWRSAPLGELLKAMFGFAVGGGEITAHALNGKIEAYLTRDNASELPPKRRRSKAS